MANIAVHPSWASPPGETILAVLHAKGANLDVFRDEVGLDKTQASELFAGVLPITPLIARSLAKSLGSTARFWLERQRQYGENLKQLAAVEPELSEIIGPTLYVLEGSELQRRRAVLRSRLRARGLRGGSGGFFLE